MPEGIERATKRRNRQSVSASTSSARRSKIMVEEPLEDLESENIETWQKLQRKKTMQQIRDLSFLSRKR